MNVPQRTPAEQAAELRSDINAIASMLGESQYEYTSKARLRMIAEAALGTLLVQYNSAAEALEAMVAQAAESGIIAAPGAAPGGGLITL